MDRIRRLIEFWNWLPAFRVVAETEHLPTASEELHVSASALSRSIRLLEESLGHSLFERRGRSLVLNEAGRELLTVVRRAMRVLDDGVEGLSGDDLRGIFRVAAPGPFVSLYVMPAIAELQVEHPYFTPSISSITPERANALLLAGELDIALLDDPIPDPNLVIERLASIAYGTYCGRGHPLFEAKSPTLDEILEFPFAAPPPEGDDHWPKDVKRKIGAHMGHLQLGVEFCAGGRFLAVLPEVVAARHVERGALRRLPVDHFEATAIYVVYREHLGTISRVSRFLEVLRSRAADPACD